MNKKLSMAAQPFMLHPPMPALSSSPPSFISSPPPPFLTTMSHTTWHYQANPFHHTLSPPSSPTSLSIPAVALGLLVIMETDGNLKKNKRLLNLAETDASAGRERGSCEAPRAMTQSSLRKIMWQQPCTVFESESKLSPHKKSVI